ncbi:MAG: glucose-1-phosphate thymidylyltransferase, partial [Crocinitomicaceae bacterium]|nr:glucose-1-phosphate thymidylyltransferase [Crocinitomicaceae bacterium]
TNNVIAPENVFIEEGAIVECSILNATDSRIYIGKQAEIMEGCMIRGSFSLGEHSQLKMGAKIYGATSIGPYCKVGGEVNNCLIFGYSNKAHDGFIGNSVIGEWCNLGADTNTSNLKNNYANVKLWSYAAGKFEDTGTQFCGLMMGDHSKSAINTLFNTASVVGVSATVFGADFPPKFIPSFSWGFSQPFVEFKFDKAIEAANNMMKRRSLSLSEVDVKILNYLSTSKKSK